MKLSLALVPIIVEIASATTGSYSRLTPRAGQDEVSAARCVPYEAYSTKRHQPYTETHLKLPLQRPPQECRMWRTPLVDAVIEEYVSLIEDPDLARLFENTFPNALETSVMWHTESSDEDSLPRTFVASGDAGAMWLRDARSQLLPYLELASYDDEIKKMLSGVVHTVADFLVKYPYCNAMQPPEEANLSPLRQHASTIIDPPVNYVEVFECKYAVDSIASFFGLTADLFEATGSSGFLNQRWLDAARKVYDTLVDQQIATFANDGTFNTPNYTYQAQTYQGSETLPLQGYGNPVSLTGLIRSAFRPSDDASIFQFVIPSNALLAVELRRVADMLDTINEEENMAECGELAEKLFELGQEITQGIMVYGVVDHPTHGLVYAYEVDGYGSTLFMDDATVPSLLSLPDIGFIEPEDEIYQNTRRMVLSRGGNPYFNTGSEFGGIGSPKAGLEYAWPISNMVRIRTCNDDHEIARELDLLKKSTGGLGLMHEAINVNSKEGYYTRPWFPAANSEFARTIIQLAEKKPHLILKDKKSVSMRSILESLHSVPEEHKFY